MKAALGKIIIVLGAVFRQERNRRLLYLLIISFIALGDFLYSGLARRTFVFYNIRSGSAEVESRLLHHSGNRETDIRRYVDEVLLGPVSVDSALLFARGTRLYTLMYRKGVVYANLTEPALFSPAEGEGVFHSFATLKEGIQRNFASVKDVRFFIGGNEAFFEEFRGIFENSADNSET